MKKVLIVTNHYLENRSGGSFASLGFINSVASLFSECHLIYPSKGVNVTSMLSKSIAQIPCHDTRPVWLKGLMVYVGTLHRFAGRTRKAIRTIKPDIIFYDTSIVTRGSIKTARRKGAFIITLHHNVEIDYITDNPPNWQYRIPYLFFLKRTERDSVRISNISLTLTVSDAERMGRLYAAGKNIKITSAGVFGVRPLSEFFDKKETFGKISGPCKFVITGSLGFQQSDSSVQEFIENYWNIARQVIPDSQLIIAGSNPSSGLKNLCSLRKEIVLIPDPEDIDRIVSGCNIYICPVNKGSGFKFRIIDGIRNGIPVLTHAFSSPGYEDLVNSGIMHVYETPQTFRESLLRIITFQPDIDKLRLIYDSNFSLESRIRKLKTILQLIV